MVSAPNTKGAEATEQGSLLLTRNLLRIAIDNISYVRGLFHEKYFSDKLVSALEMKIKKLMPINVDSRRMINWMEKGVYDALQKKYLKTLLFCICEKEEGPMIEEYAFPFSYPDTSTEEVAMNLSHTGSKKGSTTLTSNASEVTPDQMRSSACKMIRTLVSLMRTLDPMPEELLFLALCNLFRTCNILCLSEMCSVCIQRTIIMKLLYYDDVTPEDYEPPFFKCCADNEAINIWNKNPLKMEVGNVNSKHLVLALKVKSVLDPCDDNNVNSADDGMSVGNESDHDDDFSDTEVRPSEAERYIVAPNDGKCKDQNTGTISEDDTQDAAHEEELTVQVKEWICSREIGTVNVSDVLSNFPDISMEMIEDIMERLLKDGVLSRASKDGYTINQTIDPKALHIKKEVIVQNVSPTEGTKQKNGDLMYMKALYHALPMDYVTIAKLQGKLDGKANHNMVRKLIDRMVQDGYMKNSANRRLGKAVIHSESSNRKLLEIKKILEGNEGEQMAIDTNAEHAECECKDLLKGNEIRDGSTMGCLHSVGSDLFRTRELPELQQNVSMQSGQEASEMDKDPNRTPTSVREALYHALPMDYETIAQSQDNLDGEANQNMIRKLIDKMVQDGYVKNSANRKLGKTIIHSESSKIKLLEIKKILEDNEGEQMAIETNAERAKSERKELLKVNKMRDGSTMGCLYSIGSDLSHARGLPELQLNMQSRQEASAMDKDPTKAPTGVHKEYATGRILCVDPKPGVNLWILDSGASSHICGGTTWVKDKRTLRKDEQKKFYNGANKRVHLNEIGNILSRHLRLYNVYISKDVAKLELYISIGQLTEDGYSIWIGDEGDFTIHLSHNFNHIVGRGSLDRERSAYLVKFFNDSVLERGTPVNILEEELGDEAEGEWVLDSGCPYHITTQESLLINQRTLTNEKVLKVAGEGQITSKKQGDVFIKDFQLKSVYYCKRLSNNLVSVAQLNIIGYKFYFSGRMCYITYKNDNDSLVGVAHRDRETNTYFVLFLHSK